MRGAQLAVAAVLLVSFTLLGTLMGTATAHAGDGENALSITLGYGTYRVNEERPGQGDDEEIRPNGGVLGVDFERGFSDAVAWRISGGGGLYALDSDLAYSGHLTAGLTYILDVLKYVPYANIGVGGIMIGGAGQDTRVNALIELGAGLDILHSRSFSYGVQLRFETLFQNTLFFTAGARITWRWGFF